MKIKLILWDLSEVFVKGLLGAEEIIARELKISLEESIHGIGVNHTKPQLTQALFTGKISENQYIKTVLDDTGWEIASEDLKQLIRQNMVPIDGTFEILNEIPSNLEVALLSNHAREWYDYCDSQYSLSPQFNNNIFISSDIGVTKPEEKSFQTVLEDLGYKPQETLFIDDSSTNVQAAKNLGMISIQFISPEDTKEKIRNLLE